MWHPKEKAFLSSTYELAISCGMSEGQPIWTSELVSFHACPLLCTPCAAVLIILPPLQRAGRRQGGRPLLPSSLRSWWDRGRQGNSPQPCMPCVKHESMMTAMLTATCLLLSAAVLSLLCVRL